MPIHVRRIIKTSETQRPGPPVLFRIITTCLRRVRRPRSARKRGTPHPAILLLSLATTLLAGTIPDAVLAAAPATAGELRIGVLYREGDTGTRVLSGVEAAVKAHNARGGGLPVTFRGFPYMNEALGVDLLLKLLDDDAIDLVLGPIDSGVFVDVAEREEYRQRVRQEDENTGGGGLKPVISPLVTAVAGNRKGDWRFRTNVDVERRAWTAADFLSRAGYRTIGILYRDNEFGKRAQESFRKQLAIPERGYIALPYSNGEELRDQSRKILERRPGAVGVFGRRHELNRVRRNLDAIHTGLFSYSPLLFGITDARRLHLPDTYFLSLMGIDTPEPTTDAGPVEWDEVRGLAYDTTLLVMDVAQAIPLAPGNADWAHLFRDRLYNRILGPPRILPGSRTGMAFSDGGNVADPRVLTQTSSGLKYAVARHDWPELWKLGDWLEIRQRRFGLAPWFNIALVAVIALWFTLADIRRRQDTRTRVLYFRRPVLLLATFNVSTAVAAQIVAAELGIIRWDSVLGALGMAVGHRALLTTTLFQTAQGRALGFGKLYERTLAAINERIMLSLYETQSAAINTITYTNSLTNMRDLLVNIYSFSQSGPGGPALVEALDADIARAQGPLRKQEICARRLLRTMTWKQLQAERVVPEDVREDELIDPHAILRAAVQHAYSDDGAGRKRIRERVNEVLEELRGDSPESFLTAQKELDEAVSRARTERGRVYCRIRWLFIQWGFNLDRIRSEGLLRPQERFGPVSGRRPWRERWGFRRSAPSETARDIERRETPRVDVRTEGTLMIQDSRGPETHQVQGIVTNCSNGGMRLRVDAAHLGGVPEGWRKARVRLRNGPGAGAEAEALHVYSIPVDGGVQIGVAWTDPGPAMCEHAERSAA